MKVFFLFFFLIFVGVAVIGLFNEWWIYPPEPNGPGGGSQFVGVSQKEEVVLNWLREQGCTVEIPETLRSLYEVFESQNKPYDKKYQISWRVEFIDRAPALNPGDPSPPRPGSLAKIPRVYLWDSEGDTYEALVKIKEDFQKDKTAGVLDEKR